MDEMAWAAVLGVVLVGMVIAALVLRGRAEGEFTFGDWLSFRAKGGTRPRAVISDSTAHEGGATSASSGDAVINRTSAKGDLTAEAGLEEDNRHPKG